MRPRLDESDIYEIALKQFAEYGYKKTTLEDIAKELDMTGANLYSYVNSKQVLYHNSVAYALKKWQTYVIDSVKDLESSAERFETLCRCSIEYLGKDEIFRKVLKRDPDIFPIFPEADQYEEINGHSFELLRAVIEQGIEDGAFADINAEKTTRVLFTIYKTLIVETYIKDDEDSIMDAFSETMSVIMNGLLKR